MQLTHARVIHSEFLTHAMFARNASSSRAIPFAVTVKRVIEDPFIPVYWGENQSGMQAAKEIADWKKPRAEKLWLEARDHMIRIASILAAKECPTCKGTGEVYSYHFGETVPGEDSLERKNGDPVPCSDCLGTGEGINLHKQIANRLTETWAWITVCVTGDADAWSNYFALRCDKDAQPEIQKQAYMAQLEYFTSTPLVLEPGQWHTPYIRFEEYEEIRQWENKQWEADATEAHNRFGEIQAVVQVSTGRCARTSYLTQEGVRDFSEDIKLHDRLRYHVPLHASPFEHVCLAVGDGNKFAKYTGWKAYRHLLPREYVTDFQPNHPELTHVAVD